MYEWNVDRIFTLAGGVAGVHQICTKLTPKGETPPAVATVSVWRSRSRIAAVWVPVIVLGIAKGKNMNIVLDLIQEAPPIRAKDVGL